MIGRTLQRYRILEEVGHGGMAVVYRGVDESLEREVAVKFLHPHLAARPEHRRRLAREARAVARLHHPNILEIYDYSGEDSPEAYIVTELIKGRTLRAFATAHAFEPPELAAACIHELASALGHAHAQGIVHRDLKPDNVMVREESPSPVVKLMDFGIAQILDRDDRMTVTGSLIGSPAHMAPEIIDGEEADERSDIFSMGTILYWLATGRLPFEAPSPGALLKRILEGDYKDPREFQPAISDSLAAVIRDALARDRTQRIQTAAELQGRLARSLMETGIDRPGELLTRFLLQPDEARRETRDLIVRSLMRTGDEAAVARKAAKALCAYSRVITIVPGTPEAGAARQAIDHLKAKARWRRRLGALAGLAALGGSAAAWSLWSPAPPPPPSVAPDLSTIAPFDPAAVRVTPSPDLANPPRFPPIPGPKDDVKPRRREADRAASTGPGGSLPVVVRSAPAAPGRLVINIRRVWANVLVDGVPRGRTPYDADERPGPHVVRLESDCCKPLDFDARIESRQPSDYRHELEPLAARLILRVHGPAAGDVGIMVDNVFEARLSEAKAQPLFVPMRKTAEGRWEYDRAVRLRLFGEGFEDQVVPLQLRAGEIRTMDVTLKPQG